MGYYIQTSQNHNKAIDIVTAYHGEFLKGPPQNFHDIPADKALICVVDNVIFEAAGFAFDEGEFKAFLPTDDDRRPRTWLTMDRQKAIELSGYRGR